MAFNMLRCYSNQTDNTPCLLLHLAIIQHVVGLYNGNLSLIFKKDLIVMRNLRTVDMSF